MVVTRTYFEKARDDLIKKPADTKTWANPPTKLKLREGEADIWIADLEVGETLGRLFFSLLSADEIQRAKSFRFDRHRVNFIAARGILRSLIARYLQRSASEVIFQYGPFGKPELLNDPVLRFNISHSDNLAIFAFTRKRAIGVDLEFIRQDIDLQDIAARFLSSNEIRAITALPEKERASAFYNCWVRKEAFIKAVGKGVSFPLDQFEVSLDPNEPARLISIGGNEKDIHKWTLCPLYPADNFAGALAIEGNLKMQRCWQLSEDYFWP